MDLNMIIITNILSAVIFFFIGYFMAKKITQVDAFKYLVGAGVIGVWIFRLFKASFDPSITLDSWEHIITGIVVFSLWGTGAKTNGSFIDVIANKILRPNNDKSN